ncbi:MAG: zf-HC2 domain-containing protein [Bacillota bacterium]
MASCYDIRENICAYIDDELDSDEKRLFEEHIRDCNDCRRELEEMKRITRLCNELPQLELPPGFKAELHERLLEVQGSQDKIVKPGRRNKILFWSGTFASIAAGILLIFLTGGITRFGLRSSKMTAESGGQSTNMVMAAPTQRAMPAAGAEERQYEVQEDSKAYSSKSVASYESNAGLAVNQETDRSATVSDMKAAQSMVAGKVVEEETAVNRISTITILVEDPQATVEIVRTLAFENSGEEAAADDETVGTMKIGFSDPTAALKSMETEVDVNDAAAGQMKFIFPSMNYDAFVEAVSELFGEANVRISALVTEDMTDTLNELIAESARIDNRIRELQKGNNTGSSEIDELEKEKENVDGQIERIRLGSDLVTVTVNINKK